MQERVFQGVGGIDIFSRSWHPGGDPVATIVISHGFNSHSGHYLEVGEQLAAAGFAVYALDHRGRGKSGGERFYVENFDDYVADLHQFVLQAKTENPAKKTFLLGHSAGGVIATSYTLAHADQVDGLICESFAYRVPAPDVALQLLKGISHVAPHLHVLKLPNDKFSRIPAVVEALNHDPLIAGEVQPTKTVAEMVRADERLSEGFAHITVPLIILHGTADEVTRPEGSQEFFDRAGSPDKTLKLYEGHYHDLLNDEGKEAVLAEIIDWVKERL